MVIGVSKFKTRYQGALEKINPAHRKDIGYLEHIQWGHKLEDIIAKEFSRRTGFKVRNKRFRLRSRRWPWMIGNIDREVVQVKGASIDDLNVPVRVKALLQNGARAGIDCKNKDAFAHHREDWGKNWTDKVPADYWWQAQHYMAITSWDLWFFPVLVGGNRFRIYMVERSKAVTIRLAMAEKRFWDCVLKKDIQHLAETEEDLALAYPHVSEKGSKMLAPQVLVDYHQKSWELRQEIKRLEGERSQSDAVIKRSMQDVGKLVNEHGQSLCSWSDVHRTEVLDQERLKRERPDIIKEYSTAESHYRVFRVNKPKDPPAEKEKHPVDKPKVVKQKLENPAPQGFGKDEVPF